MDKNKTTNVNDIVHFTSGKKMKNRFMLAPLTNKQSHDDGTLSDQEIKWLTMRAKGQFGLVITGASNVQPNGKGWHGELGIYSDHQIQGHQKLTKSIKAHGSLAVIQIFHGGMRSPKELINSQPVGPSNNKTYNSRALTLQEIQQLKNDFISAAMRAKKAGYDGVEIHGAHGYVLAQFLSSEFNHRKDIYGGSLENRSLLLFEVLDGIREACGPKFLVGVRLSPERYGMVLEKVKVVAQRLVNTGKVDFLDISLWDVFKKPDEQEDTDKTLLDHFLELDYKDVKLTVAGKITSGFEVHKVLSYGVDFVTIGKSGIIHHDFPKKVLEDKSFTPLKLPVTVSHLQKEGLSLKFIENDEIMARFR